MSAEKSNISAAVDEIMSRPKSRRPGPLSRLCVFAQEGDPKDQPAWIKWTITWIAALAAATAPIGSAIILPALKEVSESLNTVPVIANLSVAFYMLSMGLLALWWSSLGEILGRRATYLGSFATLVVWNIIAAESNSIQMLIATRVLAGASAAAVTAVGAGTVADLWEPRHRGRAMGIFYLGPILGPLLGPLIGGGLTHGLGWRSTQWFQAISAGFMFLLILVFLPETRYTNAERFSGGVKDEINLVSSRSAWDVTVQVFLGGFRTLALLRYPVVVLAVYYASMGFGALMFMNISIETTFSHVPYNFQPDLVGCLYIFNSVGYLLASILGGPWVDSIMHRRASKASVQRRESTVSEDSELVYLPEDRLGENTWLSALLIPAALLWYGWCANFHIHWAITMMSGFVFGGASMLLFTTVLTMLTELLPSEASSGAALNNFLRNIFACVAAVAAEPAIDSIGNGWLFTIIAIIAMLSALCAVALRIWAEAWRKQLDARSIP